MKHFLTRFIVISIVAMLCLSSCTIQEEDTPATYFIIDHSQVYEVELSISPNISANYTSGYAVLAPEEAESNGFNTQLCINNTTNEVIYNSSPFQRIYPASVTKIMTALLVLEQGNLNDTVTITEEILLNDPMAVALGLQVGDTLTVDTLMHGLLICSANDCAVALARYISGSEEAFVEAMNQRAWELGATHTHFVNPHGLHSDEHYTTAYDLYLIFQELIRHPEFQQIAGLSDFTLQYTNGDGELVEVSIPNSNGFITNTYEEPEGITVLAGKTGTTNEAGRCLIVQAVDDKEQEYIVLVCGAGSLDSLYAQMHELMRRISEPEE